MKKLFYLFLMVGIIAVSCNKPEEIPATQDVIFKAATTTTGFKAGDCDNDVAHYASITIDGTVVTTDVFYLDGIIYTNTLKLSPGTHEVSSFILMNNNGTPNDTSDDTIVKATPLTGSDYAAFVQNSLPFNFDVDAFFKSEVNIEILCYEATNITNFGFAWFAVDQITVREFAFFGDFCTKYYADYTGSLYAGQSEGLRHDMPAIFKIDVYRNNNFVISYNNEDWLGEGKPLLVQYPDFDGSVDNFEFRLSILVKVGTSFEYKLFHTFTTSDDGTLANIGSDNVLDFVLGSCVPDADLILPPYMNLPESATMNVTAYYGVNNPNADAYFDVQLGGFGAGFDINTTDIYHSFCGDLQTGISVPSDHPVDVYSSLYPTELLASHSYLNVGAINWLGNNLYRYDGYTWIDLQNAIWILNGQLALDGSYTDMNGNSKTNPLGVITQTAKDMVADALIGGVDYAPPVGGWAAVMFVGPLNNDGTPTIQLLFTLVDP